MNEEESILLEETKRDQKLVEVTVEFLRLGEIDTMNEKYTAEVNIESEWLADNDDYCLAYDEHTHWNPRLYIENCLHKIEERITYRIRLENNRKLITELRYVKAVFWERLELQNFPVDVQELSITLVSRLTNNEIKLAANPRKLSSVNRKAKNTFIDQQKWQLYRLVKISERASYDTSSVVSLNDLTNDAITITKLNPFKLPKIAATCYCSRKPGYYFFNAYFLIFLITVSSLTIFSVNFRLPQSRLQITYIILLASVSFKWVINRSLPAVSYLTSLDKYAIVCIFYICLLSIWHALVGTLWSDELAVIYDFWSFIGFSSLFLFIHICFAIWLFGAYKKIRQLKRSELNFQTKNNQLIFNF